MWIFSESNQSSNNQNLEVSRVIDWQRNKHRARLFRALCVCAKDDYWWAQYGKNGHASAQ